MKWIATVACAALLATPAFGQDQKQHLEDFIHYVFVAKPDLAAAHAQQLLDSGITEAELATMLDEGEIKVERFDRAIARARAVPELERIAGRFESAVESGRLALARDAERIKDAIRMLDGTQRQQLLARRRLEAAGEYAVPALLREITDGNDDRLKAKCEQMIVGIGRMAVAPLTVALPGIDPESQRIVCNMLGQIGWQHAGPALRELASDAEAPGTVREAAERAFRNVDGLDVDLPTLYALLAKRYFNGAESLVAYPLEPTNNYWSYDAFVGLVAKSVPTAIFSEVMAMEHAARALSYDPAHREALSLFVAANLKRENDLPADAADPIFGENEYTPEFYATVYGTRTCLDVLAMGADNLDTQLVRDSIMALSQTTGGSNLLTGGGRQPLLEVLDYPDRRVRYEAALTLGRALPASGFAGDHLVVPLLASAVRTGNRSFAVVLADNEEDRRALQRRLVELGYEIVAAEGSLQAARGGIQDAVGVDLIVVQADNALEAKQTVSEIRGYDRTAAAPTLLLVEAQDLPGLRREFSNDMRTSPWRFAGDEAAFEAATEDVMMRASGGRITDAEAQIYAAESLSALRDIAITRNQAYNIMDAEGALLDALAERTGGARLLVAEILALVGSDRAQHALLDAALAGEDNQIDLLDSAADSVRRFGDRSQPHHLGALMDLITGTDQETADAAARLHGSMNRTNDEAVRLIPGVG